MLLLWLLVGHAWPGPEAHADRHLVIVAAGADPAAFTPIRERLAQLRLTPTELSSTDFAGLRPCASLLVAGAFSDREEARQEVERLQAIGIEARIRDSGAWLGDEPRRAEPCRSDAAWLTTGGAISLGNTDRVGDQPLGVHWLRGVGLGLPFRVVSLSDGPGQECEVSGFEARYLWDGSRIREMVATLDGCGPGELAVPATAPLPTLYRRTDDPKGVDLSEIRAELRRRVSHGGAIDHQIWESAGDKVVYLEIEDPGCPDDRCGRSSWAVRGDPPIEVLPLLVRRDAELVAILDLGGDGAPEGVFRTDTPPRRTWIEGQDGERAALAEPDRD